MRRNNNDINEIESTSNVCAVQSAFKGTKLVTTTTFKTLAEKYSLTKGKWMLFGETGHEIDRLWRAVADGVFRGTIPTHSAIVSATDDSHVICIPNKSFLNEADVFTLRDGIRKAGIQKTLLYKPNIYKHLGINDQNKWGIDHILHRGRHYIFNSVIRYVQFNNCCFYSACYHKQLECSQITKYFNFYIASLSVVSSMVIRFLREKIRQQLRLHALMPLCSFR